MRSRPRRAERVLLQPFECRVVDAVTLIASKTMRLPAAMEIP